MIAPIFGPVGFGNWKVVSSLICGFMAKESVVATLTVLFGSAASIHAVLNMAQAISLLVFCLLYTPCVATIAATRREMGTKYAVALVFWQTAVAWICAFIIYWIMNCII
jgi:ferrous iron transport protein B